MLLKTPSTPQFIEKQMQAPLQQAVDRIKKRASVLDRFAQKAPDTAMQTATELIVSGLAAQHFTILPNSEVILGVEGLYKVVITEDAEADAVNCDIHFDDEDIATPSVLIFKYEINTDLYERTFDTKVMFSGSNRMVIVPHELPDGIKAFFCLLCATIVRDFWVLEHKARQRVYQNRTIKVKERVGTGKDRHVVITKTHRYLPRVKYDLSAYEGADRKISEQVRVTLSPHLVSGHIRQLPEGHKASAESKEHAAEFGISLAPGCTFVRPHQKGASERLLNTYRSKSALELIFSTSEKG